MERSHVAFVGIAVALMLTMGAGQSLLAAYHGPSSVTTHTSATATGAGSPTTVLQAGASFQVSSSFDCVAGHSAVQFNATSPSVLTGGFTATGRGVTLYVATIEQASNVSEGHPASWEYTTGLVNSSRISVPVGAGSYIVWFEGADLNCGSKLVIPLEMLTTVNVTQAFTVTPE